jgi:hypothetical protein
MVQVVEMSAAQRREVERLARSTSEPRRMVVAATALLALADGVSVRATARAVGSHQDTVARWRDRFLAAGVEGIGVIAAGRGRRPEIGQDVIDAVVDDTLHSVPEDGSTCWSTRTLGVRHGVSKDTVAKIWRARNLRP